MRLDKLLTAAGLTRARPNAPWPRVGRASTARQCATRGLRVDGAEVLLDGRR